MDPSAVQMLSRMSGLDLAIFRDAHVDRRIDETLSRTASADVVTLARRIGADPAMRSRFRRSIAVSVTGIFRDPEQFRVLEDQLAAFADVRRLRVWSAGCSNGSELWSVASVLQRLGLLERSFLLGSDLLEENVVRAKAGPDPLGVELDLPRWARVLFEQRDIVNEGAPDGRWNVVLCRNVAIYLTPPARAALHQTLARALAPGGLLLLGRSERITNPAAAGLRRVAPHAYRSIA
jgi:chemotaxis protein methyltransferase CheR